LQKRGTTDQRTSLKASTWRVVLRAIVLSLQLQRLWMPCRQHQQQQLEQEPLLRMEQAVLGR